MNCFESEVVKTWKPCLNRIPQYKSYLKNKNKLKRLPANEFGYMLPHNNRIFQHICYYLGELFVQSHIL